MYLLSLLLLCSDVPEGWPGEGGAAEATETPPLQQHGPVCLPQDQTQERRGDGVQHRIKVS